MSIQTTLGEFRVYTSPTADPIFNAVLHTFSDAIGCDMARYAACVAQWRDGGHIDESEALHLLNYHMHQEASDFVMEHPDYDALNQEAIRAGCDAGHEDNLTAEQRELSDRRSELWEALFDHRMDELGEEHPEMARVREFAKTAPELFRIVTEIGRRRVVARRSANAESYLRNIRAA